MSFLKSEEFLQILIECCEEHYPYIAFADAFHTMRSMLLPVLYLMGTEVPKADVYHAICTGYGGLLACLGGYVNKKTCFLQNMGFIHVKEKKRSSVPNGWCHLLRNSGFLFLYAVRYDISESISCDQSFTNAMHTQVSMGCDKDKCRVISNGIDYDRLSGIPLKEPDGWIDIGAVVRLAPIKDIKTMIYAF